MKDIKLTTITMENTGGIIDVKKGELFRIELEELGSAGYQWHIEKQDPEFLELISKETRKPPDQRIGGPVLAIWIFKARHIGKTELTMDHYRVWEGRGKASKHFQVQINIK